MQENHPSQSLRADLALRERAEKVIPGGMYGHQKVTALPSGYPQFMARGEGSRVWDEDGNQYIDLMCGYGPILLGHHHPEVDRAAAAQARLADAQNTPSARMVELAEAFTERVRHADWAMFCKNGTDATTTAVTISRAATGRRKVLVAKGAYHGSAPWCTPREAGVLAEDRAHLIRFNYNDVESLRAASDQAGDDLAAIVVTPIRHDLGIDLEDPDPLFARAARDICDRRGAVLVLDDVRCGFRINNGGSWEHLGVDPDISCWSKAIANGHPIGAVLGISALAEAASSIYVTGSFWFAAVAMAAALATLEAVDREDAVGKMEKTGWLLRRGLEEQASTHGLRITVSGPVQMPFMTFTEDQHHERAAVFAQHAISNGVWLHPLHNWFLSSALESGDIEQILEVTDHSFAAVAESF